MSKQALLAVAFLLAAAALSPTPAGAADVNVGGGAGLTIGIGAPDWGAETARAQEQAQRHSQFVQMSTQLMGELQNSERELIDVLETMKRDADNTMQSHGAMRDSEFRTSERVMTVR